MMNYKTGPQNGPFPQDEQAASPSRRRLLQGLGMMGGALALAGPSLARAAEEPLATSQDERWQNNRSMAAPSWYFDATASGHDAGGFRCVGNQQTGS